MSEEDVEIIDFSEKENETVEESETEERETKEAVEDPKKLAMEMLKEGRPMEEIMEKTGLPDRVIYGLKGVLAKKGEIPESEGEGVPPSEEEEPIFKSPKEQLEDWFISEMSKRLPDIMGKKAAELVIRTLKDNPDIIWDPQTLRYHIVQIHPKVNKYLLDWMLNSLYRKLNEMKRSYEEAPMFSFPITPPTMPDIGMGYGMTPPRGRGIQTRVYGYGTPYYYPYGYPAYPHGEGKKESDNTSKLILTVLTEILKRLEKKNEEPSVDVPFGNKVIKVPASQAGLYITMNTIIEELKKLSEKQNEEPTVKIPTEDGKVVEMPASQAAYYVIAQTEKEKRKLLEDTTRKIVERFSPERVIRAIEESSLQRSPSPTLDLINKARQDLNRHLEKILTIIEVGLKQQVKPEVPQIPKYSPEERKKKIEEVSEAIKEAQEEVQLENEIKELVPYVVGEEEEEEEQG